MTTIQITISTNDEQVKELLIAQLSQQQYDGFEERENELLAYIPESNLDEAFLKNTLASFGLSYSLSIVQEQNWNALWESNFQPVMIDDFCAVRADFHAPINHVQHEIIITPKMSFGTGHHATTFMMMREMREIDFNNKTVADFGTGTGVLAILAEKLGSSRVWAIDNDEWSILNAKENVERNGCTKITVTKSEGFATQQKFDIILANINRNVIVTNAASLCSALEQNGQILISGLLRDDEHSVINAITSQGLNHIHTIIREQWLCMRFAA